MTDLLTPPAECRSTVVAPVTDLLAPVTDLLTPPSSGDGSGDGPLAPVTDLLTPVTDVLAPPASGDDSQRSCSRR